MAQWTEEIATIAKNYNQNSFHLKIIILTVTLDVALHFTRRRVLPFCGQFRVKRKSSSSPSPRPKKRKKKKSGRRRSRWVERASRDNVIGSFLPKHWSHSIKLWLGSNYRDLNIGKEPSDPEVGERIKNSKRNGTWRRRKRCIGAKQRRELRRDLGGDLLCYWCYCYTHMLTAISAHGEKWNSEFSSYGMQNVSLVSVNSFGSSSPTHREKKKKSGKKHKRDRYVSSETCQHRKHADV